MTDLTQTFAALSDRTRLTLVEHMMAHGEQPAGELTKLVDMTAPAVSRHLKVLRTAGLIRQRAEGTHRYYSVRPEALRSISDWTISHEDFWRGSLARLDTLLAIDPEGE